jgi:hypothetical protein
MSRKLYIAFLFLSFLPGVNAQDKVSFSQSIGNRSIGAGIVLTQQAMGAAIFFEKKIGYRLNYQFKGLYYSGNSEYSGFQFYGADNQLAYEIYNFKNRLLISSGLKLHAGLENITSRVEDRNKKFASVGGGLSGQTQLFISNRVSLYAQLSLNHNFISKVYESFWQIQSGIKILII